MLARMALIAEGCSVQAWARLSMVDSICRDAISGASRSLGCGRQSVNAREGWHALKADSERKCGSIVQQWLLGVTCYEGLSSLDLPCAIPQEWHTVTVLR